jgi:mannose-1-phosphate guanylyltransferase
MQPSDHLWVVILAAGEGKRVKALTRDRWGRPAPKQYSVLNGRTTLLDITLERARKIAPRERIVAVVAAQHRRWWVSELAGLPARNVIVQPENRGTAAGILLPLVWILRRDPGARLVILPSDHGVASEETLHNAIVDALACAPRTESGMVLLGVRPNGPETDYGWIVPQSGGVGPLRRVARFLEKPDPATAAELLRKEGLLNSFILIVGGRRLAAHFATTLPRLWCWFQPLLDPLRDWHGIERDLADLYDSIPTYDFSGDLLERSAKMLRVHPVPACGWLDLGTPDRLTGHLLMQGRTSWDGPTWRVKRPPQPAPQACPTNLETTDPTIAARAPAIA